MSFIEVRGLTTHYAWEGPAGAPVVVFSHSLGADLEMWDEQVAALATEFRCLRYDIRGHGQSTVLDAPPRMTDLAFDLFGLTEALGVRRFHLVGLSLGGMIAQRFALDHPERLASLALVSTGPYLPEPSTWAERARTARAKGPEALVDATLARWFTPACPPELAPRVAAIRAAFAGTDANGYAACCEAIGGFDMRGEIGGIRTPTLVVAGAEDPSTPPAMAEEMHRAIPGSDLAIVPAAAHLLAVERPQALADLLLPFLRAHP